MSFETVFIAVLLTGAVIVIVFFPFFERQPDQPKRSGPQGTTRQNRALETLWDEKQRVLRAIYDLDFDYDMDKLPDEIYAAQRVQLVRLAVAIMQRIDELEAEVYAQQARVNEAVSALRRSA
jgi:hypothetical protein